MIKNKNRGFVDRQRKGVGVGKEKRDFNFISRTSHSFSHDRFACALADVFEKNENKNITTSFYRVIKV